MKTDENRCRDQNRDNKEIKRSMDPDAEPSEDSERTFGDACEDSEPEPEAAERDSVDLGMSRFGYQQEREQVLQALMGPPRPSDHTRGRSFTHGVKLARRLELAALLGRLPYRIDVSCASSGLPKGDSGEDRGRRSVQRLAIAR